MPAAGVVTLIAIGLVVAALAVYLITVAVLLRSVSFNLGTIIAGVRAIGMQTEPLGRQFDRINRNLASTRQTMDDFVTKQAQAQAKGQSKSTGKKSGTRKSTAARASRDTASRN